MWVLEKQKVTVFALLDHLAFDFLLKPQRNRISNPAKAANFQQSPHIRMIRCLAYIKQAEMLMRAARFLTVICILLMSFAFTAAAQKTRKRPVPRATPRPTPEAASPDVADAKLQVSSQLHNVNVSIDKMAANGVLRGRAHKG